MQKLPLLYNKSIQTLIILYLFVDMLQFDWDIFLLSFQTVSGGNGVQIARPEFQSEVHSTAGPLTAILIYR